ncbi:hypothetical protein [Cohnella sp. GCM10027633]|uniref:hypothetical protein n=1 Tax=unclassified Cohnella TaxID=2636738 RepID=UPI0036310D9A
MWIFWFCLFSSLTNGGSAPAAPLPAAAAPVQAVLAQAPSAENAVERWRLEGVGLGDTAAEVRAAWGAPADKEPDILRDSCENWTYANGSTVGLCEGAVEFVQAKGKSSETNIDGVDVPLTNADLKRALGKPAFVADDGWGVMKGEEALKVFEDGSGRIASIDLFYGPCGA